MCCSALLCSPCSSPLSSSGRAWQDGLFLIRVISWSTWGWRVYFQDNFFTYIATKRRSSCCLLKSRYSEAGADIKESAFIQVPATEKMGTLISKSIMASQASWLVYMGEPWKRGTKGFLVMCSFPDLLLGVSLLSAVCFILQFHCWYLGAGRAGGVSAGSDRSRWRLPSFSGSGSFLG